MPCVHFGAHLITSASPAGRLFSGLWAFQDIVFQFLSFLFHEKQLMLPVVDINDVAITNPLFCGFQLTLDPCLLDFTRQHFFHQWPTSHPSLLFWALQKVLDYFASVFFLEASPVRKFQ